MGRDIRVEVPAMPDHPFRVEGEERERLPSRLQQAMRIQQEADFNFENAAVVLAVLVAHDETVPPLEERVGDDEDKLPANLELLTDDEKLALPGARMVVQLIAAGVKKNIKANNLAAPRRGR